MALNSFDFQWLKAKQLGGPADPRLKEALGSVVAQIAGDVVPADGPKQFPALLLEFLTQVLIAVATNYAAECVEGVINRLRHRDRAARRQLIAALADGLPESPDYDRVRLATSLVDHGAAAYGTPAWHALFPNRPTHEAF